MEASCSLSSLIQHRPEMQQRQPLEHGARHAEEAISAQREDIMWLMYNPVSHGWHRTWLERRDSVKGEGYSKERRVISIFHRLYSEAKASSEILSIKLVAHSFKLHLNEDEDHYSTSKLKSLLSLWRCLSLSPSQFFPSLNIFPLALSSLISLCWYLHVNDFCVKCLSLFFFWAAIYMSVAFRCLMVLRWNESNLLCDSQAILPAITLIHSGQWILMTMKPGSCEDILQALVLVTPAWQSSPCSPLKVFLKLSLSLFCWCFFFNIMQ